MVVARWGEMSATVSDHDVKSFYAGHHDTIREDRHESPYWLRRWAHRTIHERFVRHVRPGDQVLDLGCGEGQLSVRLAEAGARVTAIDISFANVEQAGRAADERGEQLALVVGDSERLPFRPGFDVVVSSHVIEHLPRPDRGLAEAVRVARRRVVIAMPTCLSPAAWLVLGNDNYWRFTRRTPFSWLVGLVRTVAAALRGDEGPQEGYEGREELPHVWRFPGRMKQLLEDAGLAVDDVEAGPLVVPWLATYVPPARSLQVRLDRLRRRALLRWCGVGTHMAGAPRAPDTS